MELWTADAPDGVMPRRRRRHRWRASAAATITAAALVVAGCGASSGGSPGSSGSSGGSISGSSAGSSGGSAVDGVTASSVTIGTTNPLTGPVGATCKDVSGGAQAWFKHVNATGGVSGRKIIDDVVDDQYSAPTAVANVRGFVSKNDFALFGGCGSIQPPAVAPIASRAGMPYLFPYASVPALLNKPTVYNLLPAFGPQLVSVIKYAFAKYGAGSTVFLTEELPGTTQTIADVKTAVDGAGGHLISSTAVPVTQTNFRPYALKIKSEHPQYVLALFPAPEGAQVVKALSAANAWPSKWILAPSTLATGAFLSAAGNLVDGKMLADSPTASPQSAPGKTCATALKDSGVEAGGFSMWGCATAQVFTKALSEIGKNLTRAKFEQVLNSWKNYDASPALGTVTFGSSHTSTALRKMYIVGYRNGQNYNLQQVAVGGGQ